MNAAWLPSPLVGLVALGIFVFWLLGAYNRLVRLRAAVQQAFGALDEQLTRQLQWLQARVPLATPVATSDVEASCGAPAEDLPATQAQAWLRLRGAVEQFGVALAQARAQSIDAERMASLSLAHDALRTSCKAVLDVEALGPSTAGLRERWQGLLNQARPLNKRFNDAVLTYNQAIRQFPASLLAHTAGFRAAGRIA